MRNKKENKNINKIQSQSGVTLIILVVTIVVILILAAITVNYAWKDNGILKTALGLQNTVTNAEKYDKDKLADATNQLDSMITNMGLDSENNTGGSENPEDRIPAAPTITVNGTMGENGYYASNIQVIFHKNDKLNVMTYKIEGVTEEKTMQDGDSILLTDDGSYTIIAYHYSDANKQSKPATVKVVKDTIAPNVT